MRIQGYCTDCHTIRYVRVRIIPPGSIAWGICADCEQGATP